MFRLLLIFLLTGCVTVSNKQQEVVSAPVKRVTTVKPYQIPYPIPKITPRPFDVVEKDHLRMPACMTNAVNFWESVYTSTGSTTFIFNDKDHTIYKVEENVDWKSRHRVAKRLIWEAHKTHDVDYDDVKAQIGAGKTFRIGLERGYQYIPMIKKRLKAAGLPEELAFIPLIESSFNLKARSKVGALGAWQIMPRTMKLYVKAPKNRLYDINFATDVAIKILKHNYELLGSWPLAVNAYHSGPGRLMKAQEFLGTSDICTITQNFEGRGYKTASRNYYAQFLAAKNLYYRHLATNLVSVN
jgi:membrane-bound lytic murein transglycosylase D